MSEVKSPSHEELHEHVNPHLHHSEVPPETYKTPAVHIGGKPLKSKWRLDWIWRKVRMGNFHPFPLVMILLVGLPMVFMILLSVGVNLGFSFTELPIVKPIVNYMGIYSDGDMFVTATWVYWWPAFIVAILFFKRIWCGGFCPFGLITDIGNFFGKKLRKGKAPKPVNIVKYIFMGFLTFKALGYLHDAIGITNSIVLSIEFVVFFIVYAFIIGLVAPRRTFCRLFCFLGSLPHLFGRLSFYTLETDRSKCASCEGQWCLTGHKAEPKGKTTPMEPLLNLDGCPMFINVPQLSHTESNRNCILCGNCIKNCPYDAIHYKPKVPGYELYKGIDLNHHEVVYVLGFIPLLAMFLAMETGALAAFGNALRFPINSHPYVTAAYYGIALVIGIFAYYLICGIGAVVLNVKQKLVLRNFGYVFLPFLYMAMIRDIVITYFLKGSFIPVEFPDIVVIYPFIDIPLMLIGGAWSIYMAYKISQVTLVHAQQEVDESKVLTSTLLLTLAIAWLTNHWVSSMAPEYSGLLAFYDIHISVPFFVGGGLILAFTLVVRYWQPIKSLFVKEVVA